MPVLWVALLRENLVSIDVCMPFPQCERAGNFDSSIWELQVTIVRTKQTDKGLEFSERQEAAGKEILALEPSG